MFKIIKKGTTEIVESGSTDLYQYKVYIGPQLVKTNTKSSYWYVKRDAVFCSTGDGNEYQSDIMCVEIFGYTPESKSSTFTKGSDLPYVNGCSTKQLIPPARPGDPTFQYLYIPVGTSEQVHHIHATPRIVYVAKGYGKSIVGTSLKKEVYDLNEGDVIILGKMVPHHFETIDNDLTVLPVHIFSSVGQHEFDHPMYNGTHKV